MWGGETYHQLCFLFEVPVQPPHHNKQGKTFWLFRRGFDPAATQKSKTLEARNSVDKKNMPVSMQIIGAPEERMQGTEFH